MWAFFYIYHTYVIVQECKWLKSVLEYLAIEYDRWFDPLIQEIGPKLYIFGNQFYLKNARKLRFNIFLHFHVRKDIS